MELSRRKAGLDRVCLGCGTISCPHSWNPCSLERGEDRSAQEQKDHICSEPACHPGGCWQFTSCRASSLCFTSVCVYLCLTTQTTTWWSGYREERQTCSAPHPTTWPFLELTIYGVQHPEAQCGQVAWGEVWSTSPVKALGPACPSFLEHQWVLSCQWESHMLFWVAVAARWQKIPQPEHHFPC